MSDTELIESFVKLEYKLLDSCAGHARDKTASHSHVVIDHKENLASDERSSELEMKKCYGCGKKRVQTLRIKKKKNNLKIEANIYCDALKEPLDRQHRDMKTRVRF